MHLLYKVGAFYLIKKSNVNNLHWIFIYFKIFSVFLYIGNVINDINDDFIRLNGAIIHNMKVILLVIKWFILEPIFITWSIGIIVL